ncbi:MAG TPA: alpha/beta hydrolase [Alphaproteobacteria bacterium]|nr:alpha/beta hydrolase [Alphaproteobacteria bacterium]
MTGLTAATPPNAPETLHGQDGVSIAYHRTRGKSPGVVFLGGFMSDMTGTKAVTLEAFCRSRGCAFLRFDYRGHGASSGRFEDGTIGSWAADALAAFDQLTEGPQILVGSSMGGWIALLTALARRERAAALVGIAPAPDFTEDLLWEAFPPDQRAALLRDGVLRLPSEYSEKPYSITLNLIEDGRRHLLLRNTIDLACPVRLLHGMRDPDVPWQRSLMLAEKLATPDVRVELVKDGDHRLSREQDLTLLCKTVEDLIVR